MLNSMKILLFLVGCCCSIAAAPTIDIKVDQVGYQPNAPKIAVVVSSQASGQFTVRRKKDDSVVFRGTLTKAVADQDSGDQVQLADFSTLNENGTYYLDVAGVGKSWSFAIGKDVYARALYLSMRAFYGQRCGTAVDLGPEFPGFKHAACHLSGAYHETSGKTGPHISAKGWHDAGDYGRYIVNSGISTGELLWTWEMFGERLRKVSLNIPESTNSTPDFLDEIRWNLDWMMTMQDVDGGVWHKQTSENFADFVMPENDKTISYVIGVGKEPFKGSTATADFAVVMAIAARIYKPFDASYAQSCLKAAEKAWMWLEKYPSVMFRNTGKLLTGEYGDNDSRDELLWAAAELFRTTRKDVYATYFNSHYVEQLPTINSSGPPSWPRVAPLGLWTYVLGGGSNAEAVKAIRESSLKAADEIVTRTSANQYRHSLTTRDYVWGSTAINANYGVQLLVANAMKSDARYVHTAAENIHYLLGRNTFSLSWVTQLGENPYRHPHHRPSQADNNPEPWPGMLSGGPNRHRQDPAMKRLANLPPAKMYLDDWESYATNEICLNWNAPLVFVLAGLLSD
jgi:endoglucanase